MCRLKGQWCYGRVILILHVGLFGGCGVIFPCLTIHLYTFKDTLSIIIVTFMNMRSFYNFQDKSQFHNLGAEAQNCKCFTTKWQYSLPSNMIFWESKIYVTWNMLWIRYYKYTYNSLTLSTQFYNKNMIIVFCLFNNVIKSPFLLFYSNYPTIFKKLI